MRALGILAVGLVGCGKSSEALPRLDTSTCPDAAEHRSFGLDGDSLYAGLMQGPGAALTSEAMQAYVLEEAPTALAEYQHTAGRSPLADWTTACATAAYLDHATRLHPPADFSPELVRAWQDVFDEHVRPGLAGVRDRAASSAERAAASGESWAPRAQALAAALRAADYGR